MRHIVFDLETDGLLRQGGGKQIHCMGMKIDGGLVIGLGGSAWHLASVFSKRRPEVAVIRLRDAAALLTRTQGGTRKLRLVGHGILGFDVPFLEMCGLVDSHKLQDDPAIHVFDTLVGSWLSAPDLLMDDFKTRRRLMPAGLLGKHSLKAWGHRIGVKKDSFGDDRTDWSTASVEMLDYCIQDVEVTDALFKHLYPMIPGQASTIEMQFAFEIARMEANGFAFNTDAAVKLYGELSARRDELQPSLVKLFPPKLVQLKTKVKEIPFNPGSRPQITANFIKKYKWKPTERTEGGSAKLDEEVLSSLPYPEAKPLMELFKIIRKIGSIAEGKSAWLRHVTSSGRIHGQVFTIGAPTGRCSHRDPNMANVSKDADCRSLFTVSGPDRALVGIDCKGLQLRCLAHYLTPYDGGSYTKQMMSGDPHAATMREMALKDRESAKAFRYAMIFGAGDKRLGEIIEGLPEDGAKARARFFKKNPGFKMLKGIVEECVTTRNLHNSGFLIGLDGRRIPIRKAFAAVNALLMTAEAVIVKDFTVRFMRKMHKRRADVLMVGHIHDEVQLDCSKKFVPLIKSCAEAAIKETEKFLEFTCPLAVEVKVGTNWSETH